MRSLLRMTLAKGQRKRRASDAETLRRLLVAFIQANRLLKQGLAGTRVATKPSLSWATLRSTRPGPRIGLRRRV